MEYSNNRYTGEAGAETSTPQGDSDDSSRYMNRLIAGFRKAHALGDREKALLIGREIRRLQREQENEEDSAVQPVDSPVYPVDEMSTMEKGLVGVGRGMTNVGRAVQDGYYRLTGNTDALHRLNDRIESEQPAWNALKEDSTAASIGEVVGEVAATAPIGGLAGAGMKAGLVKAGTKLSPLVTGGLAAAVDGGVSAATVQRGGLDGRIEAAAKGAAFGAGTAGVLGVAGKAGNRFLNSGTHFVDDTAKRADDIAEATGIPIHLTDARPDMPVLQKAEGVVNDVPFFGTSAGKIKQNKAAQEAVEGIATRHGFETLADAEDALAVSIRDTFEANQQTKGTLYKTFWDELEKFGDVPRTRTNAYINELLDQEAKANGVGSPHSRLLRQILETKDGSASTLHRQFQQVRAKASAGKNSGGIDKFTAGEMSKLADAMKADAADFAKVVDDTGLSELKDVSKKLADADNFYVKNVLPFKENQVLKSAINSNEPEKILKGLTVGGGSKERTRAAYNALNKEGQQRMQSAFLLDAYQKSMQGGVFSSKTFRTHLNKLDRTTGILFSGEDRKVFDRLVDILEFTQHSAQAASNPMNGSRMVMATVLGGTAVVSVKGALLIPTAASLFKVATQTKSARRLLTASMERTDRTKAMDFVVDYLGKNASRMLTLDYSVEDTPTH